MMRISVFVLTCVACAGRRVSSPNEEASRNGIDAVLLALSRLPVVRSPRTSSARPIAVQMNEDVPVRDADDPEVTSAGSVTSEKLALSDLSKGMKVTGKVTNVAEFGSFLDIGVGKDALLHVSKMDDSVKVEQGDEISVFIERVDAEQGKISVTMKEGAPGARPRPTVDVTEYENADEKSFIKGVVRQIATFGAFVQLKPGVDGLLHISQLSKDRVEEVTDVINVGDEVDVRITEFENNEKGPRISLSMIPWEEQSTTQRNNRPGNDMSKYENADPSEFITGEVVRIVEFGAFVRLEPGVDGLLHISQLSDERVERVDEVVQMGEQVNVRVVECSDGKISLSMLAPTEGEGGAGADEVTETVVVEDTGDGENWKSVFEIALEKLDLKQKEESPTA